MFIPVCVLKLVCVWGWGNSVCSVSSFHVCSFSQKPTTFSKCLAPPTISTCSSPVEPQKNCFLNLNYKTLFYRFFKNDLLHLRHLVLKRVLRSAEPEFVIYTEESDLRSVLLCEWQCWRHLKLQKSLIVLI